MPYQSETIKTVLDRLNAQYFLPAIQRHYVWRPDQIILLFDSIMRGYPISSFLFWELTSETRDNWEIYEFCQQGISGGTPHIKKQAAHGINPLTLVLDGQQRLTSMLIGLKGSYKIRKKGGWYNPALYPVYKLYLDLLKDPKPVDDDAEFAGKPYYGFQFSPKGAEPRNDDNHWWFEIGQILDCANDDRFYELRETEERKFPPSYTKAQENMFERNLWRLYEAIWKDPAISYYVEHNQDYDRVLDIFVRANEAGTQLNKVQILMAMLTSKWSANAKDMIEVFIGYVNGLGRNKFGLEFVMRTCLVLCDLPVRYRINNFTNQNITKIENNWEKIKSAIERAIRLVNAFNIGLTSQNALIPIAYYLYQHPEVSLLGTTLFDERNASLVRRWLILVLLNKIFGRAPEQVLVNTRHVLTRYSAQADFPFDALNAELEEMGRSIHPTESFIQRFLGVTYPNASFHLSLLYNDHAWAIIPQLEQDHIFPKALFDRQAMAQMGLDTARQERYLTLRDRIGNLELLNGEENRTKKAQPFETWLATRDSSFRKRHLIPEDDGLLKFERFEDFIKAREALIAERLKAIVSPVQSL